MTENIRSCSNIDTSPFSSSSLCDSSSSNAYCQNIVIPNNSSSSSSVSSCSMDEQSDDSSDSSSSPSPSKNDVENHHERLSLHQQDLGAIDEDCSISSCFEQWWLGTNTTHITSSSSPCVPCQQVIVSNNLSTQNNCNDANDNPEEPQVVTSSSEGEVVSSQIEFDQDDDDDLWNFLRDQLLSED